MSNKNTPINDLLQSYEPQNTLLAHLLLQSSYQHTAAQAIEYVVDYFFEHHLTKQVNELQIAWGDLLKITFQLTEFEYNWGCVDTFLDYKIYQGEKQIVFSDYALAYDSDSWGDLSYYRKDNFDKQIKEFLIDNSTLLEAIVCLK